MGALKLTGKAAAALCLVLLIPILFVIMLPYVVFGGVENARYSVDSEVPILNDETVIENNANTAYELVHSGQIFSFKVGRQLRIPKQALIGRSIL